MKIFLIAFLVFFVASCGKNTEPQDSETAPAPVETKTTTVESVAPRAESKKYTLTIIEADPEEFAPFEVGYKGNLQFSEKTEDGEGDFEYNIAVLGNNNSIESLIVAYIPKDDELHQLIGFEDRMYDLGYAIADAIPVGTPFEDVAKMEASDISEHEILALAVKDFFVQISEK